MADKKQLKLLKSDVQAWNKWRKENPKVEIDLTGADLERSFLERANLRKANLRWANLGASDMYKANFSFADLTEADLSESDIQLANFKNAHLEMTNLFGSDLSGANFFNATLASSNLSFAILEWANLQNADLSLSILVETNLNNANISNSIIYGISAWDIECEGLTQKDLVISPFEEYPEITVDNLEVAQFIYLLINNRKIKNVIDTITAKSVLILGRFTTERKKAIDAIREKLRQENYLPIVFDFEPSNSRDLTETITLLARMSRFIIADLSDPRSLPQELASIIPDLPSVPIQPIIVDGQLEYGMYEHWRKYPWVLKISKYKNIEKLIEGIKKKIIAPPEKWLVKKARK